MDRRQGYTLIELMIVVAIMLILAVLAYPGYASYMVRAHRSEAQAALLQLMQEQERYYTLHNTYLAFTAADDNLPFQWWLGSTAQGSAYELSGRACDQMPLRACIELRAEPGTPKVDASFRDAECETLTLNSVGQHGAGGKQEGCWP
ncbi:MAG: type IV pilin protein [Pseudomonadota bacterium]